MSEIARSRLDELAAETNTEHHAFRRAFKATYHSALRAGDLLNEAKAEIGHGNWLAWVEGNCEFSMRTAQVYMRIANNRDRVEEMLAKNAESARLTIDGVLREIAAQKGPEPVAVELTAVLDGDGSPYTPASPKSVGRPEDITAGEAQRRALVAEMKRGAELEREKQEREGPVTLVGIRKAASMNYIAEWSDGQAHTVDRKALLKQHGYKKCACCRGYGVTRGEDRVEDGDAVPAKPAAPKPSEPESFQIKIESDEDVHAVMRALLEGSGKGVGRKHAVWRDKDGHARSADHRWQKEDRWHVGAPEFRLDRGGGAGMHPILEGDLRRVLYELRGTWVEVKDNPTSRYLNSSPVRLMR